jgi:hypothetical protein
MQSERILFKLSETAAIGADDLKWILYRSAGRKTLRSAMDAWKGVSFVRSTKAILLRCIREKGLEVSPEGWELLGALPETFDEWKSAQVETCPAVPISRVERSTGAGGAPEGPVLANSALTTLRAAE